MIDDSQLEQQLLKLKLVNSDELERGRQLQQRDGTTLYLALLAQKAVDESIIVDIAADLINIPSVNLARYEFDPEVIGLISFSMASEFQSLPLAKNGSQLLLAMTDPLDIMAMDEIATHTGIDIQPVLVGPGDLSRALSRAYNKAAAAEPLPKPQKPDPALELIQQAGGESLGNQDSWGAFFDGIAEQEPKQDSEQIAQDMRDRPSSLEMDLDDLHGDGDEESEPIIDLGGWEVDSAENNIVPGDDYASQNNTDDYGEIGTYYVLQDPLLEEEEEESDAEEEPQNATHTKERLTEDIFDDVFNELSAATDDNNPRNSGTQIAAGGFQFDMRDLEEENEEEQEENESEAPADGTQVAGSNMLAGIVNPPNNSNNTTEEPPEADESSSRKKSLRALASLRKKIQKKPEAPDETPEETNTPEEEEEELEVSEETEESSRPEGASILNKGLGPLPKPGAVDANKLGRLALKKIAVDAGTGAKVKKKPKPMAAVVERNSHRERQEAEEARARAEKAEREAKAEKARAQREAARNLLAKNKKPRVTQDDDDDDDDLYEIEMISPPANEVDEVNPFPNLPRPEKPKLSSSSPSLQDALSKPKLPQPIPAEQLVSNKTSLPQPDPPQEEAPELEAQPEVEEDEAPVLDLGLDLDFDEEEPEEEDEENKESEEVNASSVLILGDMGNLDDPSSNEDPFVLEDFLTQDEPPADEDEELEPGQAPNSFGMTEESEQLREVPTREIHTEDLFGMFQGADGSLQEPTAAADEATKRHVDELTGFMKNAATEGEDVPEHVDAELSNRVTTMNQALTMERLKQMTLEKKQQAQQARLADLPIHLSDHQLMRALITLLIEKEVISRDELIELATAHPDPE